MNRFNLKLLVGLVSTVIMLNSCSNSDEDPNPCTGDLLISIDDVKSTIVGQEIGEITVSATGGSAAYMFSIDGTTFQSSGTFTDLGADDYTVIVKDGNECVDSDMATVEAVPEVFYANQIRPIIDANCQVSGCHGSNASIPTWATYNDVKARADRIRARTSAKEMPPGNPLVDSDIKLIADWVDQGAPNN